MVGVWYEVCFKLYLINELNMLFTGHCLCNFTETELKESILKDCLSPKKTFCSGYKKMSQQGHCNKTLCMDALMKCKGKYQ